MKRNPFAWIAVLSLSCLNTVRAAADQAEDEAAIRKTVESYTDAFNKRDPKAMAAHWLPKAVYLDPTSGKEIVGRDAIEKHFTANVDRIKNAKLTVAIDSIRFVSPHVAVERGTSTVVGLDKEPIKNEYIAIHVKHEGKWLLDRVSDDDQAEVNSNYDKLKELEWMLGSWVDQEDNATIETHCKWSKNQSFLVRTFSISVGDQISTSGVQFIGWDPAAKQIRSWIFDSNGGFSEGMWTRKDKRWQVQIKETLVNGQKASSLNVITFIDKNTFTWELINRQSAGELLPDVGPVKVIRKSADE